MLNETQILQNWNDFRQIVNTRFSGERKIKLNNMYDFLEDRIGMCPASGKEHFHNAFPGGYVDHVLRVIRNSDLLFQTWKQMSEKSSVIDYSEDELLFCSMHHDLGKVGNLEHDYYVVNDSSWHREKQGLLYKFNPAINNMTISDRTFNMLNHFHIEWNEIEFLGIKCTDGLYDPENEVYLKQPDPGKDIKTSIVYTLHWADMAAARTEKAKWNDMKSNPIEMKSSEKNLKSPKQTKQMSAESQKLFEGLFS